ncbi:MAG: hypothetical protein JWQ72_3638, partial [Polaromonas sp.]|nr:hypothetical protein [Polaromonas sp.]
MNAPTRLHTHDSNCTACEDERQKNRPWDGISKALMVLEALALLAALVFTCAAASGFMTRRFGHVLAALLSQFGW